MAKYNYNNMFIGLILGLIVPIIVMFLFYFLSVDNISIQRFVNFMVKMEILSQFIVLAVIPNLLVFFFFLNRNFYYAARGVILATIIFSVLSVVLKYLIS